MVSLLGKEEVDLDEGKGQVCLDGEKICVEVGCLVWVRDNHSCHGLEEVVG